MSKDFDKFIDDLENQVESGSKNQVSKPYTDEQGNVVEVTVKKNLFGKPSTTIRHKDKK